MAAERSKGPPKILDEVDGFNRCSWGALSFVLSLSSFVFGFSVCAFRFSVFVYTKEGGYLRAEVPLKLRYRL